jgi:hypothetical protein
MVEMPLPAPFRRVNGQLIVYLARGCVLGQPSLTQQAQPDNGLGSGVALVTAFSTFTSPHPWSKHCLLPSEYGESYHQAGNP